MKYHFVFMGWEMVVVVGRFYTVLFSTLKQTHWTLVCDSNETLAIYSTLLNYTLKWCTRCTVWLLHGWCHVKLLPPWCMFCVHHTTVHLFTVSLDSKPHTRDRVHVHLGVTCHLHFWQIDKDLFMCYCNCGNPGVEQSQHRKLTQEKKTLLLTFWSRVWHSATELSQLPQMVHGSRQVYHRALRFIYVGHCFLLINELWVCSCWKVQSLLIYQLVWQKLFVVCNKSEL